MGEGEAGAWRMGRGHGAWASWVEGGYRWGLGVEGCRWGLGVEMTAGMHC